MCTFSQWLGKFYLNCWSAVVYPQLATQPHTADCLLVEWGGELEEEKWKNLWAEMERWREPNRESKSCTCKQSKTRDSPTSSHGQAGIPRKARLHHVWLGKTLRMSYLLLLPVLCVVLWDWISPFSAGVGCSGLSPPSFLCIPNLLTVGVGWEAGRGLDPVQALLSNNKNNSVLPIFASTKWKPSPVLATLQKINSIPGKTSPKRKRDV